MPSFQHGLNRALKSFLAWIVIAPLLSAVPKIFNRVFLLDEHMLLTLNSFIGLASSFYVIVRMKYWNTSYITGFLLGYIILLSVNGINFPLYLTLAFSIYLLSKRMLNHR